MKFKIDYKRDKTNCSMFITADSELQAYKDFINSNLNKGYSDTQINTAIDTDLETLFTEYTEKYSFFYDNAKNKYDKTLLEINSREFGQYQFKEQERARQTAREQEKIKYTKEVETIDNKFRDLALMHDMPETYSQYECELMQAKGYECIGKFNLTNNCNPQAKKTILFKLKKK